MTLPAPPRSLLPYLALGILQGVGLWVCFEFWPTAPAPLIGAAAFAGFLVATTLSLQLGLRDGLTRPEGLLSVIFGLIVAASAGWMQSQAIAAATSNTDEHWLIWWPSMILLAYLLIPFIQSWPTRDTRGFRYNDLYRHSWDNFFIAAVAALVTLIYWLLITLWAYLFQMLGIGMFKQIFYSEPFAWISTPLVFSIGLWVGIQNSRIITTLRDIALAICRLLLPMVLLISLLFGASLPFTGLQPIWNTGYSTPILIVLVGATLLLFNGVYQDGTRPVTTSPWLKWLVSLALWLLPVYAVLAAYSLSLRIQQYGLTPDRIYSLLAVVVALLYGLGYSTVCLVSRFNRPVWLAGLRRVNQWTALIVASLIILVHSPVLNPLELSAAHQYHRLLEGKVKVEDFDLGTLRFELGAPGRHYLRKLQERQHDHAHFTAEEQDLLQARFRDLQSVDSAWEWKKKLKDSRLATQTRQIEWINPPAGAPTSLEKLLTPTDCRVETCYVLAVDLNRDQQPELVLLDTNNPYRDLPIFSRNPTGQWRAAGFLQRPRQASLNVLEFVRLLRAEDFEPVTPSFDNLRIGESVFRYGNEDE